MARDLFNLSWRVSSKLSMFKSSMLLVSIYGASGFMVAGGDGVFGVGRG